MVKQRVHTRTVSTQHSECPWNVSDCGTSKTNGGLKRVQDGGMYWIWGFRVLRFWHNWSGNSVASQILFGIEEVGKVPKTMVGGREWVENILTDT